MQGFGARVLLVVLGTVLACGGRAQSDDDAPSRPDVSEPDRTDPAPPPDGVEVEPTFAVPPPPATGGTAQPTVTPPSEGPGVQQPPDYESWDIPGNMFRKYCVSCHGEPPTGSQPSSLRFGDDLDRIVRLGLIVPLDSGQSRIVQVMQDGSMPPPGVEPRPKRDDLLMLINMIEDPRYWTDEWTEPAPEPVFDAGPPALPADAGTSD